jgi:copper chaperone CopZ
MVSVPAMIFGQEKGKNLNTVKFTTSIHCDACVNTIMSNLPKEKGVTDVICDLKTKEVMVTYQKDKTDPELVQRNIEKLGYTAKPVKEEVKPEKK